MIEKTKMNENEAKDGPFVKKTIGIIDKARRIP